MSPTGLPGRPAPVVIKVGGSLLGLAALPARLEALLRDPERLPAALVAGGGAAADVVRGWDSVHALGEEPSHRLALRAMGLNASLLVELVPRARLAGGREEIARAWEAGAVPVIDPARLLDHEEPQAPERPLPHLWSATSDSVAAWIAARLGARELLLLKSIAPPPGSTLAGLAGAGYVDEHLGRIAAGIPRVTCIGMQGSGGPG